MEEMQTKTHFCAVCSGTMRSVCLSCQRAGCSVWGCLYSALLSWRVSVKPAVLCSPSGRPQALAVLALGSMNSARPLSHRGAQSGPAADWGVWLPPPLLALVVEAEPQARKRSVSEHGIWLGFSGGSQGLMKLELLVAGQLCWQDAVWLVLP